MKKYFLRINYYQKICCQVNCILKSILVLCSRTCSLLNAEFEYLMQIILQKNKYDLVLITFLGYLLIYIFVFCLNY